MSRFFKRNLVLVLLCLVLGVFAGEQKCMCAEYGAAALNSADGTTETKTEKSFEVKLKKNEFTYNGKAQKPVIKAVYVNGKKIAKKNYKVTYKNNKRVGKGIVIVKGKSKYKGYQGSAEFNIVLKKARITKLASTKAGTFTVSWKKDTQAKNFQLQYSRSRKFSSGVTNVWVGRSGRKQITGLTGKGAYYIRIRAFVKTNGVEWYGPWSAVKSVVIKQNGTKTQTQTQTQIKTQTQTKPQSSKVWISGSGKKYHSHSSCSNMKNPRQVSLSEAIAMGRTACSKCY